MGIKKVIVIGAGPAGLSTAYELLKRNNNYTVKVLEKSNAIGGISQTINDNGNRMDIGGHRFFSKDKAVMDMWNEILFPQGAPAKDEVMLGLVRDWNPNGRDPEKEDDVMLVRRRVSRIYFRKKFFDYPMSLSFSTIKNMGLFTTMIVGFSYLKSVLFKRKETNLENFYINRFGKKLYRMFFESYTEKVWGIHPEKLSADWGGQRVKGVSVRAVIKDAFLKILKINNKTKETSLIEEYFYPKYGPGQFWEKMAKLVEENENGEVIKGAELLKILTKNDIVAGVKYKLNGKTVEEKADCVVSSMPLNELVDALDEKNEEILRIAHGLCFRDFITLGVLVDKIRLKNETNFPTVNDIIPDCWIYVQDKNVKLGRIQIFNNWSPYMVKNFPEKIWIGLEYFCNEGDELWNMPTEDFKNMAVGELENIDFIEKGAVEHYHQAKIQKAYCSYSGSYPEIAALKDKLLEYNGLYCVGRNGQHRYNNMDHSTLTGIEAVKCILNPLLDKSVIWDVNTEKAYHETKNR